METLFPPRGISDSVVTRILGMKYAKSVLRQSEDDIEEGIPVILGSFRLRSRGGFFRQKQFRMFGQIVSIEIVDGPGQIAVH